MLDKTCAMQTSERTHKVLCYLTRSLIMFSYCMYTHKCVRLEPSGHYLQFIDGIKFFFVFNQLKHLKEYII